MDAHFAHRVRSAIRYMFAFREAVLVAAIERYKTRFTPLHFAMIQWFPVKMFGRDIFNDAFVSARFEENNVFTVTQRTSNVGARIEAITLDEAQMIDASPAIFPSSPSTKRHTALHPVIQGAIGLQRKLVVAGTGLSAFKVFDKTTVSASIWKFGAVCPVAVTTLLHKRDVERALEKWGILEAEDDVFAAFAGRPRFTTTLAEKILERGEINDNVVDQARCMLRTAMEVGIEKWRALLSGRAPTQPILNCLTGGEGIIGNGINDEAKVLAIRDWRRVAGAC